MIADLEIINRAVGGQIGMQSVDSSAVEDTVRNSTTVDDGVSFTLPLGAIFRAAGSSLPVPEPGVRETDNTTSTVEYRTKHTFSQTSGTLAEFYINQSQGTWPMFVQVYYDTFFRSFAFRDNGVIALLQQWSHVVDAYQLDGILRYKVWISLRQEDGSKQFMVVGSLPGWDPKALFGVLRPLDKGRPTHYVSVFPKTGNVLINNLDPGDYEILVNGRPHRLSLDKAGTVQFK
jgi:hypothetical protein